MFNFSFSLPLFALAIVLNLAGIYYYGLAMKLRTQNERRLAYACDAAATLCLIAAVVHQDNFVLFILALVLAASASMVLTYGLMLLGGLVLGPRSLRVTVDFPRL